jgi:hypothetical protein
MFTHQIVFSPAWDKRDPNPSKNYGVHGVHITFTIRKDGEGLTFSIGTNWHLPHVQLETDNRPSDSRFPFLFHKPLAFGVDIHLKTKPNEYSPHREHCEVTGGECWSKGSALLGEEFLQTLIEKGDEALFRRMELQFEEWKGK